MYLHPFANEKKKGKQGRKRGHRQDLVFVRPPGHVIGGFQLAVDTVWFCKVLLLFAFESRTDSGIKLHQCAFVSVMWEYEGDERAGS